MMYIHENALYVAQYIDKVVIEEEKESVNNTNTKWLEHMVASFPGWFEGGERAWYTLFAHGCNILNISVDQDILSQSVCVM